MNTFIFIWRIRFLFHNDLRMIGHKVFVIKSYMSDNSETIGNNAKLVDIAKMTINV